MQSSPGQSAAERIRSIAERQPGQAAIISFLPNGQELVLSWAELDRRSERQAAALDKAVAGLGGRAALCISARNSATAVTDIIAAVRANVPVLPLDPNLPEHAREQLVRKVAGNYASVVEFRKQRDSPEECRIGVIERAEPSTSTLIAYLLPTGGTSGSAKIVAYPGPVTYHQRRVPSLLLRRTGWRSGQRQLVMGPLHHVAPFTNCMTGILDANTVVLLGSFSAVTAWQIIDAYSVDWMQITPTHMARLADTCSPDRARFILKHLNGVLHTAASCPHKIKRAWLELMDTERIFELYTATEDIGSTLATGAEWLARPGTVGRGFFTQIKILDDGRRELPPGAVGKIFMRTPRPFNGVPQYLGSVNPATVVSGLQSVGDYGRLDESGYLYLEPRREDMFKSGGKNVYPADIEGVIMEHPMIRDVAVIPVPDEVFGARPTAIVSTWNDERLSLTEVIAHCRTKLGYHQLPAAIHHTHEIPRTESGKLQRWRLRELGKGLNGE
jgi:bile acid-coenzyme A ligase